MIEFERITTWIPVSKTLPANGKVVETKIDDGIGPVRNFQELKRQGKSS